MKRITPCLVALTVLLRISTLHSTEFQIGAHHFTLPDGFEIELVAGPPLVNRPIMGDFDERGRFYVADSAGVGDKVEKQLQEKPHRIVRLEDADGDGRFDKTTVFADKMMFPEGILWFDGAVYCGAPPSIWKLEDTDDDGVADRRSEWFQGKTLTGCANDLHGPYLGPDGRIYWCKGAFAQQTHERPGLSTISDSAAHIFRCRADGSGFDCLMSGGMDNPVEIAFTKSGEAIFTTTFYTNPEGGKRDALVHAVYGGVYPKVHGVIDGLKRTGDLMPAMTHLGPAAPSGLMRYNSRVFGADFEDNLFSTQFNLHKVQRHVLEPMGATFRTRDLDFVVSDNSDFHPTDVLEDADGSLLIVDTGGWYKLCCPTSQLAKPDVLGAIYRVRRKGAPKTPDPRGLKLDWKATPGELVKRLDDSRPAVRNRAIAQLAKVGAPAIPALARVLKKSDSVEARRNAVWALTRIDSSEARSAARPALSDQDATVQAAAVHSIALARDPSAVPALLSLLKSSGEHTKREAATALGRIRDSKAVPALLEAAAAAHDRILEHSLIYALIEVADPKATFAGLQSRSPGAQRAALIALDQMDEGKLASATVLPLLNSSDSVLKQTATWIIGHRREWAGELASFFRRRLTEFASAPENSGELQSQIVQFAREKPIQQVITDELSNSSTDVRLLLLRVIAQASVKTVPSAWNGQIRAALQNENDKLVAAGLEAARAISAVASNSADFSESLLIVARNAHRPEDLRLQALAVVPAASSLDEPLFEFSRAHVAASYPPLQRINAANVLGRSTLSEEQLNTLASDLPRVGPLELTRLLPAFGAHPTEPIGLKLISNLKQSKGMNTLAADALRTRLNKYPESVQKEGDALLQSLVSGAPEKKRHLDEIQAALSSGDYRRGQTIFNGTKAACSTCHAVGYLGGQLGPDLTRIGGIRTERDLLEAVVYPSASFVRGFEPMTVTTKSGDEYSGLVRRETSDSLVVVSSPATEQRLARAEVSEMRPGAVSIMPEGLDQQLTRQELADLVAFLRALK